MKQGADGKTDLEALTDTVVEPVPLDHMRNRKGLRTSLARAHRREWVTVSAAQPSLPKLKFLEGKDP